MRLLFMANFGSGTGYAWDTIERVFRSVGERLVSEGHEIIIAYAELGGDPPERMRGAPFRFIEFRYDDTAHARGLLQFLRLLRSLHIDALYLTDRESWSWRYALYRAAGVRRILLHDRTSGERSARSPFIQQLKRWLHRVPLITADRYFAVSRFVRERLIEANGTPPEKTFLIYNGIDLSRFPTAGGRSLHDVLGLPKAVRIIFTCARAQPYKGVQVLLRSAALLRERGVRNLAFVYAGDGPFLDDLRTLAQSLSLDNAYFLGARGDIPQLLPSATVSVVPSLWAEAFGLTVVECMAAGVPVIATRVGGIPELIEDGQTGVLVAADSAAELADALVLLLEDEEQRRSLGVRARHVVRERFSLEVSARNLHAAVHAVLPASRPSALAPGIGATSVIGAPPEARPGDVPALAGRSGRSSGYS